MRIEPRTVKYCKNMQFTGSRETLLSQKLYGTIHASEGIAGKPTATIPRTEHRYHERVPANPNFPMNGGISTGDQVKMRTTANQQSSLYTDFNYGKLNPNQSAKQQSQRSSKISSKAQSHVPQSNCSRTSKPTSQRTNGSKLSLKNSAKLPLSKHPLHPKPHHAVPQMNQLPEHIQTVQVPPTADEGVLRRDLASKGFHLVSAKFNHDPITNKFDNTGYVQIRTKDQKAMASCTSKIQEKGIILKL